MATADWKAGAEAALRRALEKEIATEQRFYDRIRKEMLGEEIEHAYCLRVLRNVLASVPIPEQPEAAEEGREEPWNMLRDLLAAIDLIDGTGMHLNEEELAPARELLAEHDRAQPASAQKPDVAFTVEHCRTQAARWLRALAVATRAAPPPSSKSLLSEGRSGGETLAWTPRTNEGGNPEPTIAAEGSRRPEAKGAPIAPSQPAVPEKEQEIDPDLQAWVDAPQDPNAPYKAEGAPLRSGALQLPPQHLAGPPPDGRSVDEHLEELVKDSPDKWSTGEPRTE